MKFSILTLSFFMFSVFVFGATVKELDSRMDQARQYAKTGDFENALNDFIWVFEQSRDVEEYGAVRLSFVLSELSELIAKYPKALEELTKLRNFVRIKFNEPQINFLDIQELAALNKYMKKYDDSFLLFKELAARKDAAIDSRYDLIDIVLSDLEMERDNSGTLPLLYNALDLIKVELNDIKVREPEPESDDEDWIMYLTSRTVKSAAKIYSLLLIFNKTDDAGLLKNSLIEVSPTVETYIEIIKSIKYTSNSDVIKRLMEEAKTTLSEEEVSAIEEASVIAK
ncbi:MAG: hypothetical protein ACD_79C01077G0002 [uncultured bacterium]|nr:MAG: hypothetical protein ACD_79C01077G0002 [uncultured bacterium]